MTVLDAASAQQLDASRGELAHGIAPANPEALFGEADFVAQRLIEGLVFLRILEDLGLEPPGQLRSAAVERDARVRLLTLLRHCGKRYRCELFSFDFGHRRGGLPAAANEPIRRVAAWLCADGEASPFSSCSVELLGSVYEHFLATRTIRPAEAGRAILKKSAPHRRGSGVYYTPGIVVEYLVGRALGALPDRAVCPRIVDPACGAGYFLVMAYRYLLERRRDRYLADGPERHACGSAPVLCRGEDGQWRLTAAERERILLESIHGVDCDPHAVEITKLSLVLSMLGGESDPRAVPDLAGNIRCGDSLVGPDFSCDSPIRSHEEGEHDFVQGFDWQEAFPAIIEHGGFDAVLGNPPWGQKGIRIDQDVRQRLRKRYQSLSGIFDLFRPFVERGIRLLRRGGVYGMVLPDVVLLKDYAATRRYMLENLALTDIRWWGMPFPDAVIDAVTLVGKREPAAEDHLVHVQVDDPDERLKHEIPQADFLANPRYTFNLHLTREKRDSLASLAALPRLADFFEVHEGVHSGNVRSELFVSAAEDESCRRMYFGRDEIVPFRLHWKGRYLRLAAVPTMRMDGKYANLGRPAWHESTKVLVRRTGDRVLAAVDEDGHYASNNFFIVLPKTEGSLDLHGLCALLNSRLMTWYFRAIEPRKGRVFAELKIKHIRTFPLPRAVEQPGGCEELNLLGRRGASAASTALPRGRKACSREWRDFETSLDQHVCSVMGWHVGE